MVFKLFNEPGDYLDIETGTERNLLYADIVNTPDGVNVGWDIFGSIEDAMLFYKIKPKDNTNIIVNNNDDLINNIKEKICVLENTIIDFKDYTYFILNLETNSSFVLNNLKTGIIYNFTINNINAENSIYICIPNTNDIANENLIEIPYRKSYFMTLFYDGLNRIWKKN